jgi:HNH endonuclease
MEPYADVRDHTFENLIALCPTCHTRYDSGDIDRLSMKGYKANLGRMRVLDARQEAALAAQRARQDDMASKQLLRIEQERRYDEMRPELEGRLVPWQGNTDGRRRRVEVRIRSRWKLSSILVEMPVDPRVLNGRSLFQARQHGPNTLFRPGEWVYFDGLVHLSENATGTVTARAKCRDEEHTEWEDIFFPISLTAEVNA